MTKNAYLSLKRTLNRAPRRADGYHQALTAGQLHEALLIYCQWLIYRAELINQASRLETPLTGDMATRFERYCQLLPLDSAQMVGTYLQAQPCGLDGVTDRSRPARLALRSLRAQVEGYTAPA